MWLSHMKAFYDNVELVQIHFGYQVIQEGFEQVEVSDGRLEGGVVQGDSSQFF